MKHKLLVVSIALFIILLFGTTAFALSIITYGFTFTSIGEKISTDPGESSGGPVCLVTFDSVSTISDVNVLCLRARHSDTSQELTTKYYQTTTATCSMNYKSSAGVVSGTPVRIRMEKSDRSTSAVPLSVSGKFSP